MTALNLLDTLHAIELPDDAQNTPLVNPVEVAAVVQRCLALPVQLTRAAHDAFRRAPFAPNPAGVRLNARLRFLFAKQAIRQIMSLADVLAAEGVQLPEAERLPETLRQIEDRERDAFQHWELPSKEGMEEALAASARGETLEVTDAFAQMAGLSREQLLEKVEAHKRSRGK